MLLRYLIGLSLIEVRIAWILNLRRILLISGKYLARYNNHINYGVRINSWIMHVPLARVFSDASLYFSH